MTSKARARFVVLLGVLGGALVALAPGCSLDWNERADVSEGAAPDVSNLPDVTVADTGKDVTADAPGDATADCPTLSASLGPLRLNAKKCTIGSPGQCSTTVKDECGCPLTVRAAGSDEANTYTSAVASFLAVCPKPATCPIPCNDLGPTGNWACLAPPASGTCKPD